MGELSNQIKKITSNKNTVTVIGVILMIFLLYFGYTFRVHQAISPVSVPYARSQIPPGTQITEDMVGLKDVPPSMLKGNVIKDYRGVVNKYSSINTIIPSGSLFYESVVVEKEQVPTNVILEYPAGYVLYNMSVNTQTTYGNSMYPGNYIDIYLKAVNRVTSEFMTEDANKVMLGRLLKNVEILAVKDSDGNAVFADLDDRKIPAMIVFAIPEEQYILLKKAEFLSSYDSTLIPVPTNESLKDKPGKLALDEKSGETLKEWINRVTIWQEP